MTHSFAVCAYGDSNYLETCLRSLRAQSRESELLICTATPSDYIERMAKKYEIRLFVRDGEAGIGADWNYAMQMAEGKFVTLAHQDDVYGKHYAEALICATERWPDMELFTTGAATWKCGKIQSGDTELVKRFLRMPLKMRALSDRRELKRALLRFGNPVICPSCAYRKDKWEQLKFSEEKKFVLDWDYLFRLAGEKGRWICEERPLILHRIHEEAATVRCMEAHVREREEYEMFCRMWPERVAKGIMHFYRRAYGAYGE